MVITLGKVLYNEPRKDARLPGPRTSDRKVRMNPNPVVERNDFRSNLKGCSVPEVSRLALRTWLLTNDETKNATARLRLRDRALPALMSQRNHLKGEGSWQSDN